MVDGLDVARTLYPDHFGLWLNPHAPGGGLGIPWLDLRRIATGLERQAAGPLRLSDPAIEIPQFYALLTQNAHRTPSVRSLRRAWVQPALGAPYLAIGLDVYDTSPPAVDSVRAMMQQSIGAVPDGLPVSTVAMSDEYDPVALWMRASAAPSTTARPTRRPRRRLRYPGTATRRCTADTETVGLVRTGSGLICARR